MAISTSSEYHLPPNPPPPHTHTHTHTNTHTHSEKWGIRKMNALRDLKGSCHRYLPGWFSIFLIKKDSVKQNMALRAQFQMLILTLHLALHICSTPDFNIAQVLVQDLLLQILLKVKSLSQDVTRCCSMHLY